VKTVVQRVIRAEVRVGREIIGAIGPGVLLLVGVERADTEADADTTARKIAALRIFPGRGSREESIARPTAKPMDLSLIDAGGACLVVSQFTLVASLAKGNRPSFESAEQPSRAEALYLRVADQLRRAGLPVEIGRFGANMQVELINDGPVTFLVFTRSGSLDKEP
jgi:D-tyrosyl-tRNA(Tyr) deacylase